MKISVLQFIQPVVFSLFVNGWRIQPNVGFAPVESPCSGEYNYGLRPFAVCFGKNKHCIRRKSSRLFAENNRSIFASISGGLDMSVQTLSNGEKQVEHYTPQERNVTERKINMNHYNFLLLDILQSPDYSVLAKLDIVDHERLVPKPKTIAQRFQEGDW